jgi:hypothetical protein
VAYKPCTCHGTLFRGPTSHFYPSIVVGDVGQSDKVRLCPSGLSDVLGIIGKHYESQDRHLDDGVAVFASCGYCGCERADGSGAAVFLTVYARGGDRQDFVGAVCDEHLAQAAQDLFLAT